MQLKVLGSSGSQSEGLYTTSLLLNERVLVDAGTGVCLLDMDAIEKIGDAVITHSHLDHVAMMCFVADGRVGSEKGHGLCVHCLQETADAIRKGILNNEIWPDFENIIIDDVPLMSFNILRPFVETEVSGIRITPIPVEHTVPTLGFCIHGDKADFVFISDIFSLPPETVEYLGGIKNLHAMTIEVSYPEGQEALAKVSGHLTPLMLEELLAKTKLSPNVPMYYCHIKSRHRDEIVEQMNRRFGNRAAVLEQELVFDF